MDSVDTTIVGAGVIGLAIARACASRGDDVLILEAETAVGTQTSARNSEVIHAGIYYPEGSLKAELCRRGRDLLYDYCRTRHIPHKQTGKLIVATTAEETAELDRIERLGCANGVGDLERLTADAAQRLEPDLACIEALHSPSTGILDSHAYMLALLGEAEDHGAALALGSRFEGAEPNAGGFIVAAAGIRLQTRNLVIAAGIGAQTAASAIDGVPPAAIPPRYLSKGCYFSLQAKAPFRRLIYPVPQHAGLGIHLTLDLAGRARFGPDAEWVDSEDLSVPQAKAAAFETSIRRYWPGLPKNALAPDYAGLRPKIQRPGEPPRDFQIAGPADHGLTGLALLFGIESPGLTASLAIADRVSRALETG